MQTERIQRATQSGALISLFLLYAYLKRDFGAVLAGDHGVYYYVSYLWTQGVVPYRDVFISHPPVQLLLSTLTILVFGKSIAALNALPALCGALSALLVFLMTRRACGTWVGIFACALILFSTQPLVASLYYTGQNIGVLLLLLSFLLFLRGNTVSSGITSGIGFATSINTLMGLVALLITTLVRKESAKLPRLIGGFALSAGAIHLFFASIAGKAFWEDVYLYHLSKTVEESWVGPNPGQLFSIMFQRHVMLTLLAAGTVFLWARNWRESLRNRLLSLMSVFTIVYLVFLLSLDPLFSHYFLPLGASCTVLAAIFLDGMTRWPRPLRTAAICVLGMGVLWTAVETGDAYRIHKKQKLFPLAQAIATHVNRSLRPDQTLYGGFGVTPIVALIADRRIAGNEVDSSVLRFHSGFHDLAETIAAIEEDNVGIVLSRRTLGIAYYPPFRRYMKGKYFLERTFSHLGSSRVVECWRRKQTASTLPRRSTRTGALRPGGTRATPE